MSGLRHNVTHQPAVDLLARAIAIAVAALVIFIGLPFIAVLAAG